VVILLFCRESCGDAFDLLKVVDVVAGHGFDDGPEGHGATLGVGGTAAAVVVRDGGQEEEIPVAGCLEESHCGLELVGAVACGPDVLVEGLDDVVGLAEGGGQGLTEAEGEDDFAVGEVGGDLADAPFTRGGVSVDLGGGEVCGEGSEAVGGTAEDGNGVLTVEVAGVWI
jgi:hypothetical protein